MLTCVNSCEVIRYKAETSTKMYAPLYIGVTDITSFGKRLESSLGHTLNFCPNLVQYRFKNMYLKESPTRSSMVILSTN